MIADTNQWGFQSSPYTRGARRYHQAPERKALIMRHEKRRWYGLALPTPKCWESLEARLNRPGRCLRGGTMEANATDKHAVVCRNTVERQDRARFGMVLFEMVDESHNVIERGGEQRHWGNAPTGNGRIHLIHQQTWRYHMAG